MSENEGFLRVLPNFDNSDEVAAWAHEWEKDISEQSQDDILLLIQGVSNESSRYGRQFRGRNLQVMNALIEALDEYMFESESEELKNKMLVALGEIPNPRTDMMIGAKRSLFKKIEESSKEETGNIMKAIMGDNDSLSL